ncbi:MAG: Rrf2 family transcriptional regulator [Bacteroidetes bacterium]|nr:Rrf2 family transcriptional regulator [Bacteroidota bacterium]
MFSKACEYALKASIYIAQQSILNKRVGLKDIAKAINSPEAFTAKILQQLSKDKIIDSAKGPSGGFSIDKKKIETMKLGRIVKSIDGDSLYRSCSLGFNECSGKNPCPLHHKFKVVKDELCNMLETTTVKELTVNVEKGLAFLQ